MGVRSRQVPHSNVSVGSGSYVATIGRVTRGERGPARTVDRVRYTPGPATHRRRRRANHASLDERGGITERSTSSKHADFTLRYVTNLECRMKMMEYKSPADVATVAGRRRETTGHPASTAGAGARRCVEALCPRGEPGRRDVHSYESDKVRGRDRARTLPRHQNGCTPPPTARRRRGRRPRAFPNQSSTSMGTF